MLQNTNVTNEMQNYFASVSLNKDILNGSYLTSLNNSNFVQMVKHLYPWEEDKTALLNPWSHIWEIINDKFMNYFGEAKLDDDITLNYFEIIQTMLSCWFFLIGKEIIEWKPRIKAIDGSKYYYDWEVETIIEVYEKQEYNHISEKFDNKKYYLYVQRCENSKVTNKLYEIESKDVYAYGTPVSLDTIEELTDRQEEYILPYRRMVDSIKVESSMIERVKSIIFALDRKFAEAEKQYTRYTEQFKIFDNIDIPENCRTDVSYWGITYKTIDFDKLGSIVTTNSDNWSWDIKIVQNTNNLLTEALQFAESQIRLISAITDIPLFFFGMSQEWGNDSGTSKIKSSWSFYKRIENYRNKFTSLLNNVCDELNIKTNIEYDNIIRIDEQEIIEVEEKKLLNGVTTRLRAIMKIHKVDKEEAQEILNEIQEENKIFNNLPKNENNKQIEAYIR